MKNFIQLLKFSAFTIGAGVVQVLTFFIMNDLFKLQIVWISNITSIVFSVIFSFTFNRKFTFKEANNVFLAMGLVAAYYGAFIPLSGLFSKKMTGILHPWLIEFISLVVNFITEYFFNKFIVYRKRKVKGILVTQEEAQNLQISSLENNSSTENLDSIAQDSSVFLENTPIDNYEETLDPQGETVKVRLKKKE